MRSSNTSRDLACTRRCCSSIFSSRSNSRCTSAFFWRSISALKLTSMRRMRHCAKVSKAAAGTALAISASLKTTLHSVGAFGQRSLASVFCSVRMSDFENSITCRSKQALHVKCWPLPHSSPFDRGIPSSMQMQQVRICGDSRNSECCSSCLAVGLLDEFSCSSSFNSARSATPTRARSVSGRALKSHASAWASTTPKAYMSLDRLCSPPGLSTSGAVYTPLITTRVTVSKSRCGPSALDVSKSLKTECPSALTSTLSGLRSRCTIPASCRYKSPSSSPRISPQSSSCLLSAVAVGSPSFCLRLNGCHGT